MSVRYACRLCGISRHKYVFNLPATYLCTKSKVPHGVQAVLTDAQFIRKEINVNQYLALSKSRLSLLVVSTAASGYLMAPGAFEPLTLAACLLGTGLTAASANSINQILESQYDAKMKRTQSRPLVTGKLSDAQAKTFATVTGVSGTILLLSMVNPLSGILAASNLGLYTSIYTPLKRYTVANTWVGAIVGAIPPLIGWSAATGGCLDAGGFLLASVLFSWQFPHFHALSWNCRSEYEKAGYKMASVVNPDLCRRSSLNHSLIMLGLCAVAPCTGLTEWYFAAYSLPVNAGLLYYGWRFYRDSDSSSSRQLFRYTLIHLPVIMLLLFISKRDAWNAASDSPLTALCPVESE